MFLEFKKSIKHQQRNNLKQIYKVVKKKLKNGIKD